MNNDLLILYIKECEESYKEFLRIPDFPKYELLCKELTLKKAEMQGFDSWATALYDFSTGKHSLEIWSKIYTLKAAGKGIVFHELTHILDDTNFVKKDRIKYIANHGYTEYHASQIQLMQLLGAKNIYQHITFSVSDMVKTVEGEKTVKEFVNAPRLHAIELINRTDFPADFETMKVTLGRIFNYYGRRSICKLYALDYIDDENNNTIANFISSEMVSFLNDFMIGWFDNGKVEVINEHYKGMLWSLRQKYNLH